MSTDESDLIDRVRSALAQQASVEEVPMFGGLSFMVNARLLVSVGGDGTLLVRIDPERRDQLLSERPGVRPAEMAGRMMGPAWLRVDAEAVATDEDLGFWVAATQEFNGTS